MVEKDPKTPVRILPAETPGNADLGGRHPSTGWRRWVVPAVAVAAVAVFLLTAERVSRDPSTLPTSTTAPVASSPFVEEPTTTTTRPPTLAALAPGLDRGLALVIADSIGGEVQRWTPEDRMAQQRALTSRPDIASFDVSGSLLMYETVTWPSAALHVGPLLTGQPAVSIGVHGAQWHSTRPGVLAWIAQAPTDDSRYLYTAVADTTFGDLGEIVEITEVPEGSRLAAFGDWGYAIEWTIEFTTAAESRHTYAERALTILDDEGRPVRTLLGELLGTGRRGIFVVAASAIAFDISRYVDPAVVGSEVVQPLPPTAVVDTTFAELDVRFEIERDAVVYVSQDWLAELSLLPNGLFRVSTHGLVAPRRTSRNLEGSFRPIGLTSDGERILLQDLETNELVVLEPSLETTRIPVQEGRVAAALVP